MFFHLLRLVSPLTHDMVIKLHSNSFYAQNMSFQFFFFLLSALDTFSNRTTSEHMRHINLAVKQSSRCVLKICCTIINFFIINVLFVEIFTTLFCCYYSISNSQFSNIERFLSALLLVSNSRFDHIAGCISYFSQ